ncbi:nitrile hydratase [Natronocella acetinitrilica]|uniref:Nitrile hydratase n=1 Tax=Natronocella acetinitrilica TaxID=414046 RepID=A0AAE3GB19_9GAMM|nr:SH3-like domain-containing protein [Natronocella acetinitrilica]MCP1676992.1 nitrile hydratase [Natronocella acetinitrilica]
MSTSRGPLLTGARVTVRTGPPEAHCRTPAYLRGKQGEVMEVLGSYRNPSLLAFNKPGLPRLRLYRVRFPRQTLWPQTPGNSADSVVADLYEHWLIPSEDNANG